METFYTEAERKAGKPQKLLRRALEEGRIEDEGWRVRKDGTPFWADVILTAIRDDDGKLVGFAKVTRDLTDRKRLELERLRAAQAEEALRVRDEFLSIASHELKTPLTALQLQLDFLTRKLTDLDESSRIKLERASRSADRLGTLVSTLLDVSRLSSGEVEIIPREIDLGSLVDETVDRMRSVTEQVGSEIRLRIDAPFHGRWDRLRMEQVLSNLLANGARYGAGRPIEVSLVPEGEKALLCVRDHGPGIAEVDRERIFGRFERGTNAPPHAGMGLGLYVSRQVVEAHGGRIWVENAEDGGARFVVELPRFGVSDQAAYLRMASGILPCSMR